VNNLSPAVSPRRDGCAPVATGNAVQRGEHEGRGDFLPEILVTMRRAGETGCNGQTVESRLHEETLGRSCEM